MLQCNKTRRAVIAQENKLQLQLQVFVLQSCFKQCVQKIFYPSIDRIEKVTSPILFIRGMKDEIVPHDHTEKLFKKAENAKFK